MSKDTQGQQNADTQAPEFEATVIPVENYADNPNISKYKTVGDLIKGHGEAVKLVGAKGVIVPGDNAEQSELDTFYNTLGRPEKPDGYKFDPLKDIHAGLEITPEVEANFNAFAHKHGLTQKQAAGIRQEYFGNISQSLTKQDESIKKSKYEAETALRGEWGADYDTKVKRTQSLIEKFGGEGARDAFGELGNNPVVLKVLATIADKFSEDNFTLGTTQLGGSVSDAQKKINAILSDPKHMYHNTGPGHKEAVAEMLRLNTIIHPDTKTT